MRPILFELFGRPVHSFGVMVALAFLAAFFWARAEARRVGRDPSLFTDALWRVALGGVVGARLLYVAVHREELAPFGLGAIAVWRGGLVWYGGLAGGLAAGLWYVKRRGAPLLATLDLAMPGVWLGLAIGRIGCWLVADDWGRPTDVPWAVRFAPKPGSLLDKDLFDVALHPTQLYDSFAAFVVFLVTALVLRRATTAGRASGVGLALYAAARIVVEVYRGDDVARGVFGPLSTSQWLSLPLIAAGLAIATRRVSARAPSPASGAGG
jgi:phosphatidylglycerol:prolipoprotein diacylglycerol transferase